MYTLYIVQSTELPNYIVVPYYLYLFSLIAEGHGLRLVFWTGEGWQSAHGRGRTRGVGDGVCEFCLLVYDSI